MSMEKGSYTRLCDGGPLDDREIESRFAHGFLLVDKPNGRVVIYEWAGDYWVPRGDWETWDKERSRKAADGAEFDVIAYDPEGAHA